MHPTLHQADGRVCVPPKDTRCEIRVSQSEECFALWPSAAYALVRWLIAIAQAFKGKKMNTSRMLFKWILRFVLLYILFIVLFMIGSITVADMMPDITTSEPGLVSATSGILIIAFASSLVIAALILTSRWTGWRLAVGLALAYYGAITFVTQIETWYFLSAITVSPQLLPRLFAMGVPTALLFIPLAVWILGKGRAATDPSPNPALVMPVQQWIWKLAAIVVVYLLLYWGAGYFIAWQNPELRAFYGQPGEALPFLTHTANTLCAMNLSCSLSKSFAPFYGYCVHCRSSVAHASIPGGQHCWLDCYSAYRRT